MKRKLYLASLFLLLAPLCARAQTTRGPLTRSEILGRLALNLSPSSIAYSIKTRGVAFTPDVQFIEAVKRAGGAGVLAERLSEAESANGSEPVNDPEQNFQHFARCAALLHSGDHQHAAQECRAAIEENPRSPWPLFAAADASRFTDAPGQESGPELIRRALILDPTVPGEVDDANEVESALSYFAAVPGGVYSEDEDAAPAREQNPIPAPLQHLLDATPELASTYVLIASRYLQAGMLENCVSEFEEAIRLEPDNPNLHAQLAELYLSRRNVEGEISERREVARIVPYGFGERLALAHALQNQDRTDEVIFEWRDYLALVPDSANAANELAWIYATSPDPRYQDRAQALALAREAAEASKEPAILDTLAEALLINGNAEEALELEQQAAALAPNDPQMQARLKRFELAEQQAEEQAARTP
jgi:tetratricopeptide (TPR) repeat protein